MATTFSEKNPITRQGTYGTIEDFGGGGMAYSDPRDNPNYKGVGKDVVGLSSANGSTIAQGITTDINGRTNQINTVNANRQQKKQSKKESLNDLPDEVNDSLNDGLTPEEIDLKKRERALRQAADEADDAIDDMILANKAETSAYLSELKGQYRETRKSIEQSNKVMKGVYTQSGIRSGAARYAPEIHEGIVQDVVNEGIAKLQELDTKYNAAISSANAALKSKNYILAKQKADEAVKIEQDFLNESRKRAEEARKINEETRKQSRQATRDEAVAGLISQGITDKKQMLDYLNYYEDGTSTGGAFTADELDKTVKALAGSKTDIDGAYDKLSGDVRDFYLLRDIPNGLPSSILSLPPDQQLLAWIRTKGDAGRKPEGADKEKTYAFSNDARGKLIGTGLSNEEVDYIEQGINQYGAEEVLSKQTDLTEDQKGVLRSLITGKERTFINDKFIKDAYDDDVLRKAANIAGYDSGGSFWSGSDQGVGDEDVAEYIADLMATVETYRQMGLTDKEIQKKMDEKIQELVDQY